MARHIYISPQAAAVALSCGGQIIANPARHSDTIVVNVFTSHRLSLNADKSKFGKPFPKSSESYRNLEHISAWRSLEVAADHVDLPEARSRSSFPFALIAPRLADEIINQLCIAIRPLIVLHPDAAFYFPAGFGNRIDHLICREAAFRLLDEGALAKVRLYEDAPYCWLGFIREPYYRVLARSIRLNEASRAVAFRPGGLTMSGYLKRRSVPFPRGKKRFVAIWASLGIQRIWHEISRRKPSYQGNVSLIDLSNEQILRKKDLLFHYRSQISALFGDHPNRLLKRYSKSLATEVLMEIARTPAM